MGIHISIPFYKSIHYTKENHLFHTENKLHGTLSCPFYMPSLIKIDDIYELEVGIFMNSFVHGSLPYLLCDLFTFAHNIHIYQTRQISQIRLFIRSTTRSSYSLLCKGPVIWNAITTCIQQSHSVKRFVLSLKSIVVRGYEDLAQP